VIAADSFPKEPAVAWKWKKDGARVRRLTDPATGEVCAEIFDARVEDVDLAVKAAEKAFRGSWQKTIPAQRAEILAAMAAQIDARKERIAWADCWNMGKPLQSGRGEAGNGADTFRYYAGLLASAGGQVVPVAKEGFDFTIRVPFGVVVGIVPWNFPFPIACWKTAAALAAGNCVVLKPAQFTPWSALLLAEAAREAGLPEGVLQVLPGGGSELGDPLVTHPGVRKISFTGSTEIGRHIMKMAANDIKRVSLELGGKSPNVVFADADVDKAAAASPISVFDNTGQDCCARSRILVEEGVADRFVKGFVDSTNKLKVGDPKKDETALGPLVHQKQLETTESYVEAARKKGRKILCGGKRIGSKGFFYEPTLIVGCEKDDSWWQEEIFGPVASLRTFRTEEEAVQEANDSIYGLSGSLWTLGLDRALRVALAIESGNLSVNSHSSVFTQAPFGGVKQSGIGRELGQAGLEGFSEPKNVFIGKP
jgi:acyl-CoA reductase-like NAD-dependent aldehyde dehydrogenase